MLNRIKQRADEGRAYTPERMGMIESLIFVICPGLLIFGVLIS